MTSPSPSASASTSPPSSSSEVLLTFSHGRKVATLTLNRPSRANALTPVMLTNILHHLATLKDDPAVRVLVLTGNGKYFCTGMDLGGSNQAEMRVKMAGGGVADEALQLYESLKSFPKPVIARLNGSAMGGGFGLLLCADIRLGLSSSFYSFSEVKRGIVPALISAYVVPELGASYARRFFLTGERVQSPLALKSGILTEVSSDVSELDSLTEKYAAIFIANAPNAMKVVKGLVADVGLGIDKHEHNKEVVKGVFQQYVVTSKEAMYGMACFESKTQPDWSTLTPQAKL